MWGRWYSGSRDEGVGIATQRDLLSPVGIRSLLVHSEYVGAVCIHHEDLVVPIPVTLEGDAFAIRRQLFGYSIRAAFSRLCRAQRS